MTGASKEKADRDRILIKLLLKDKVDATPEEVAYFRKHPDEIDEITAPVNVHKLFLLLGSLLGILLVWLSKILNFSTIFRKLPDHVEEFLVDIVFEIGVALIGAAVTAYLLGILLNTQQKNAKDWRQQVRRRIREAEQGGES